MNCIKKVIEERDIEQTWLADMSGKSFCKVRIYAYNRRQPNLEVLFETAKLLYIYTKDLVDIYENN